MLWAQNEFCFNFKQVYNVYVLYLFKKINNRNIIVLKKILENRINIYNF